MKPTPNEVKSAIDTLRAAGLAVDLTPFWGVDRATGLPTESPVGIGVAIAGRLSPEQLPPHHGSVGSVANPSASNPAAGV